jgi:hypothetical protein
MRHRNRIRGSQRSYLCILKRGRSLMYNHTAIT